MLEEAFAEGPSSVLTHDLYFAMDPTTGVDITECRFCGRYLEDKGRLASSPLSPNHHTIAALYVGGQEMKPTLLGKCGFRPSLAKSLLHTHYGCKIAGIPPYEIPGIFPYALKRARNVFRLKEITPDMHEYSKWVGRRLEGAMEKMGRRGKGLTPGHPREEAPQGHPMFSRVSRRCAQSPSINPHR